MNTKTEKNIIGVPLKMSMLLLYRGEHYIGNDKARMRRIPKHIKAGSECERVYKEGRW
jgi:hypothetical protein